MRIMGRGRGNGRGRGRSRGRGRQAIVDFIDSEEESPADSTRTNASPSGGGNTVSSTSRRTVRGGSSQTASSVHVLTAVRTGVGSSQANTVRGGSSQTINSVLDRTEQVEPPRPDGFVPVARNRHDEAELARPTSNIGAAEDESRVGALARPGTSREEGGIGLPRAEPIMRYFKPYFLIEGTQKTHLTVILEGVLESMTVNQVLFYYFHELQF